jgi:hypothetical protein
MIDCGHDDHGDDGDDDGYDHDLDCVLSDD